ncbi:hypothetical protein ANN_01574 [Periplaneta americana]|uniref:Uncharacterized protein n=1 Tax=Periplaneta americana TaxID=6978 RepID=A0ABQ8TWV7_PERAM|nr:hypothetical protein ANN_01574 [Periplaneta americana]
MCKVAQILEGVPVDEIDGVCVCDIPLFKYARLTSYDVERSFSQRKSLLRDNRHAFVMENFEMTFVVHCNSRPTTSIQVWLARARCEEALITVLSNILIVRVSCQGIADYKCIRNNVIYLTIAEIGRSDHPIAQATATATRTLGRRQVAFGPTINAQEIYRLQLPLVHWEGGVVGSICLYRPTINAQEIYRLQLPLVHWEGGVVGSICLYRPTINAQEIYRLQLPLVHWEGGVVGSICLYRPTINAQEIYRLQLPLVHWEGGVVGSICLYRPTINAQEIYRLQLPLVHWEGGVVGSICLYRPTINAQEIYRLQLPLVHWEGGVVGSICLYRPTINAQVTYRLQLPLVHWEGVW